MGAEVDVVLATDLDSGSFGEVTYNITGGNEVSRVYNPTGLYTMNSSYTN